MDKITQIEKFLLNEIENLESKLKEAEKIRKKYLFIDESNRLKHYEEIYNFVMKVK